MLREISLTENVCSMYPESRMLSGYCFLSSHCCGTCEDFNSGHTILLRQLECIVDDNWVSCCSGILFRLLVYLNPADEHSQQFRCQIWHLQVFLCFVHKFLNALFPHIQFIDALSNGCQFLLQFRLFLLITSFVPLSAPNGMVLSDQDYRICCRLF